MPRKSFPRDPLAAAIARDLYTLRWVARHLRNEIQWWLP